MQTKGGVELKIVIPREELEYKSNVLKMSIAQIAKTYGYNKKTISRNLKEYGIRGYNRFAAVGVSLEEIKHEYFVIERTVAQIAVDHKCTARTIYQWFADAGIKVEFRYPAEIVIPIAKLEHMYCVLGMTTGEIGKEYGCTSSAVLRKIKKNGLYGKRNVVAGTKRIAWNKGLSKETSEIIANYAKKLIGKPIWNQGLTKDTHPSLLALSNKFKGRNKDNHEGVARQSKIRLGRTKENCEYMARAAEKRRGISSWNKGKNKYNNDILARISEGRKQYCGEKASNWKGGLSFEPYTKDFNKRLKEQIRIRDGYTCQGCGTTMNSKGRRLSVHHIDYDKSNIDNLNLISLCIKCHVKTNSNREYWKAYYKIKVLFCEPIKEVQVVNS